MNTRHPAGRNAAQAGFPFVCLVLALATMAGGASRAAAETTAPGEYSPVAATPDSLGYVVEQEFLLVPIGAAAVQLAHGFVQPGSVRLVVEGRAWQEGEDFRLRARSGIIVPLRSWREAPADRDADGGPAAINAMAVVKYRFLPVPVATRRDLRPVGKPPTDDDDDLAEGEPSAPLDLSASRSGAGNLSVTGSKTVQVSSGNRREMTVDQNLRLSITGQLTDEIFVRAFLSDDNLPVVPEGNTEELRDIDKVLVEMVAPTWQATLGDFVARRSGTTFGNYQRKLQGASMTANFGRAHIDALAGSPRGRYRTLQTRGQESNQGPYYLGAGGGELVFIVAGSERVTLDGRPLVRGADQDYTIDYVRGTVTFTYRQLITADSDIVIEYEEGEGPYGRTVLGGGGGLSFDLPGTDVTGKFDARVIREKDDPRRLRTGELSEGDADILAEAGDDPLAAVAGGVFQTESGEGQYDQVVEDGKTIYVYNAAGGDYELTMFYAGAGLGDYVLDFLTEAGEKVYKYEGDGEGSYLIGRPLPLPDSQTVTTLLASLGDTTATYLTAEWNASDYDQNVVSDLDNDDNDGTAAFVRGRLADQPLSLGGRGLGRLDLRGFFEDRSANFRPFQVHKTVFSYDQWGLLDRAQTPGFLEESEREMSARAAWQAGHVESARYLALQGRWGDLRHGESLTADQISAQADWTWRGGRGRHYWQQARSEDQQNPLDITRIGRLHEIVWRLGPVQARGTYNRNQWADDAATGGRSAGYRLEELGGGLASLPGSGFSWRFDYRRGLADSLQTAGWALQRDSRTYSGNLATGRVAGVRLTGEATVRQILSPTTPEQMTRLGRVNLAGQWLRSRSDWSLGYRVDNNRTEVLDGQIVFVGESLGDYDQDGEFVGKGQGDYNFVVVGTDSLVATTGVQADLRWRQGFQFMGEDHWYGAWSGITTASLESHSTTEDVSGLLLLQPSVLFDPETTVLTDLTFSQELHILQHVRALDVRGKFDFRKARDRRFADHPEDRLNRGYQVTGNLNVSQRSSLRLRWYRLDERRASEESSTSARRSIKSLTRVYELGWNWRPTPDVRAGIQAEYITRQDEVSLVSQKEYALRPNGRWRFMTKWTVQAEMRLAEVESDEPPGSVRPWFYSYPGRNFDSSLRLVWDPTEYLNVGVSWFARKQGDRRWQQDVRLESTARF